MLKPWISYVLLTVCPLVVGCSTLPEQEGTTGEPKSTENPKSGTVVEPASDSVIFFTNATLDTGDIHLAAITRYRFSGPFTQDLSFYYDKEMIVRLTEEMPVGQENFQQFERIQGIVIDSLELEYHSCDPELENHFRIHRYLSSPKGWVLELIQNECVLRGGTSTYLAVHPDSLNRLFEFSTYKIREFEVHGDSLWVMPIWTRDPVFGSFCDGARLEYHPQANQFFEFKPQKLDCDYPSKVMKAIPWFKSIAGCAENDRGDVLGTLSVGTEFMVDSVYYLPGVVRVVREADDVVGYLHFDDLNSETVWVDDAG